MVGISASQMDEEAFEGLQVDVTALIVKYKRETRTRAQAASMTPRLTPMPPAVSSHAYSDYAIASNIALQQAQQCPAGYIPGWQRQYQQHRDTQSPEPQRPSSAPTDFYLA